MPAVRLREWTGTTGIDCGWAGVQNVIFRRYKGSKLNIPRSKPGVRTGRPRPRNENLPTEGEWARGIENPEIASLVGQFITSLVHIEEDLARFYGRLILLPTLSADVARQAFRAMRFAEGKIQAMRALLQNANVHAEKPAIFDEVIDGYETINKKRNDYAHSLWYTHQSGRVFITKATTDALRFDEMNRREITKAQLERDIKYLVDLIPKIDAAIAWEDPHPIAHGYRRVKLRVNPSSDA